MLHDSCLDWQVDQILYELVVIHELSEDWHDVTRAVCFDHRSVVQDDVHTSIVTFLNSHVKSSVEPYLNNFSIFFASLHHCLIVNHQFKQIRIDLTEIEKDSFKLLMVVSYEVSICEACPHIEQIVVWLRIKHISLLVLVLLLNLVFDHKRHVAEWKRDVLPLEHQPVVVLVVEPVASLVVQGVVTLVAFHPLHALFEVERLNTASLLVEDHLVVSKDVQVS